MSSIFDGIGDEGVEQLDENLRKWFKEKWVRFGPDGKIRGACARGSESEGKPKCLPQKKAHSLGKKGRASAASRKRREDPNPERRGKAKNVATKKKTKEDIQVNEKWSQKYKDSINCSNPKGFSQKAHCAGKKKNEDMYEETKKCPECGGPMYHESMMTEKKDACYHKVKSRYKVWPSAYASGALVQCRKKGASNWGTGGKKNESNIMKGIVDEASGTPGGIEMFRTPAMVNATMQQSLYNRDLKAVKDAEKKKKRAEYRKDNPTVTVPKIQIGAVNYPIPVIQNWIDNKDMGAALDFAVNKFAHKQSNDFKTELAGDPNFQKVVKNFFNVAEKILNNRNSTRTKGWDGKIRAAARDSDISDIGFDAINKINDVLLSYYKKYGVDKTGRRVPPGFNYALGEGAIIGHDKDDPQVAVLGGAGSYSLSNLKKKAQMEANELAKDVSEGKFKNSAYNVKQLANTLNTIVAAEEEMEKLYFGEELKEGWLEGAGAGFLLGLGTGHPTLGTVLGAALGAFITAVAKAKGVDEAKENPKYYIFINGKQYDNEERSAWDAATVIADLAAKEHDIKTQFTIADAKTGKVVFRKYWEPEKEEGFMSSHKPAGWRDQWHDDDIKEDYTGEFAAELTPAINPYGGLKDRKHRGAISETPTDNPTGASGEGGWRRTDIEEEQLDEKCWKGYKKQGTKKMFGKTYPNCVKNTNEEEQLDEKCWDTHKQVGMKNKGGRQVPNCVPKESAIMRGIQRESK